MVRPILTLSSLVLIVLAAPPIDAAAQMSAPAADRALVGSLAGTFRSVATNVLKAAEQLPEDDYAFRPAESVRTFGQIIGHVADSQRGICAMAAGRQDSSSADSEKVTSKAALIEALKTSIAQCDSVFASLDDRQALQPVQFGKGKVPAATVLAFNTSHSNEHYGNLVTYMRIKGLVPPSSQQSSQE